MLKLELLRIQLNLPGETSRDFVEKLSSSQTKEMSRFLQSDGSLFPKSRITFIKDKTCRSLRTTKVQKHHFLKKECKGRLIYFSAVKYILMSKQRH